MRAVEIMKKAIKDSNLNGFTWKADRGGLHWEYGVTFKLRIEDSPMDGDKSKQITFIDECAGVYVTVFVIGEEKDKWLCDSYHDFTETIEEGIYWAARKMIAKANNLY